MSDSDDDYKPRRAEASALPRIPPSPDFRLAAHPAKWEADLAADRILPVLVRVDVEPGTHHVGKDGGTLGLEREFKAKGWDVLEPEIYGEMPGAEHDYYVQRIRVTGGKRAHLPVWQSALDGSTLVTADVGQYNAFRAWLVDERRVTRPRTDQIRAMIRDAETAQAQALDRADRDPRARRAAEQWAKVLEVWNRALAQTEPVKPAPATRRRAKKGVGAFGAEPGGE